MAAKKPRKPNKNIKPPKDGTKGKAPSPDGGRPRIDLGADDLNLAARCIMQHCTQEETAAIMQISVDTLTRRLAEIGRTWEEFSKEHMAFGRASLRRLLWEGAEAGHFQSQETLAREHLGFRERKEVGFDPEKPAKFVMNMGKKLANGEDDDETEA